MVDDDSTGLTGAEPPRRSRAAWLVVALLLAAVLGAAAGLWGATRVGWVAWNGWNAPEGAPGDTPPLARAVPSAFPPIPGEQAQAALGVRIAELEQRIARLDLQTAAAENDAARAEGLMIAFAARRAVERGLPLGYLENQLRLRFGDAQPNAVATVIAAGGQSVTRTRLLAGLNALAPQLAATSAPEEGLWGRVQRELSGLFVLRKAGAPPSAPERLLERARDNLESGLVEPAIDDVERLPARALAAAWLDQARRYVMAQRALDLLETAALLDDGPARARAAPAPPPAAPPEPEAAAGQGTPAPAPTSSEG